MRILLVSSLLVIISCKNDRNPPFSKQAFSNLVNFSIDSLANKWRSEFDSFERVIPVKDTIVIIDKQSIKYYYASFFSIVNYNNQKITLSINAWGSTNSKDIKSVYENDESPVEYKLEGRSMPIIINNIYYRVVLGKIFDRTSNYLLNIKIDLLQNYIYFNKFSK